MTATEVYDRITAQFTLEEQDTNSPLSPDLELWNDIQELIEGAIATGEDPYDAVIMAMEYEAIHLQYFIQVINRARPKE